MTQTEGQLPWDCSGHCMCCMRRADAFVAVAVAAAVAVVAMAVFAVQMDRANYYLQRVSH